ncbi:MAG: hypothetical protein ACREGK_12725 [Geminicoccales bacterium]
MVSRTISRPAPAGPWVRVRAYLALNPLLVVQLAVVLVLGVLIIYPAFLLLADSFRDLRGDRQHPGHRDRRSADREVMPRVTASGGQR